MATVMGQPPPRQDEVLALAEGSARALVGQLAWALEELGARGTGADGQEALADCGEMELAEHLGRVAQLVSLLAELRGRGC
jgi:hypothetical protein